MLLMHDIDGSGQQIDYYYWSKSNVHWTQASHVRMLGLGEQPLGYSNSTDQNKSSITIIN